MNALCAKQELVAVGLMSGTSLDGVDAAVVRISGSVRCLQVTTLGFVSAPYTAPERKGLARLCSPEDASSRDLAIISFALGAKFGEVALAAIEEAGLRPPDVDIIGSHGQTVWHQPTVGRSWGFETRATLQIGEPDAIAAVTGLPVVADFRVRDLLLGGEGAPLVPYFDWLVLSSSDENRVALNIGGIANLTQLPTRCSAEEVTAFDTGPGNMLIDLAVTKGTNGTQIFDLDGLFARSHPVRKEWLHRLLEHPFYSRPAPKSAGREDFGASYLKSRISEFGVRNSLELVGTFVELTTATIADAILHLEWLEQSPPRVIVSGGGVHNEVLMRSLRERLPASPVVSSSDFGIDPDAKEAIAFAVFAGEFVAGRPANLPAVTGASRPTVLGKLSFPPTWR